MAELEWQAVRELVALASRLRELIDGAMLPSSAMSVVEPAGFAPALDVWENDDEVIVEAELPGARSADMELRLENNSLLLAGELPEEAEPQGRFLRVERMRGRFHRVVPLPAGVGGKPAATIRQGVLRVSVPKLPPRRRVQIVEEDR
jgi:HSP20 family protein